MPKFSAGGAIFFAAVFFLLILPPVFVGEAQGGFVAWTFPLGALCRAILAVALLYFFRKTDGAAANANDGTTNVAANANVGASSNENLARQNADARRIKRIRATGVSMATFGFLCTCAAVIELILHILKRGNAPAFPLPEHFSGWTFCVLTFAFSSLYEETMYRFYVPEMLSSILCATLEKINKITSGKTMPKKINKIADGQTAGENAERRNAQPAPGEINKREARNATRGLRAAAAVSESAAVILFALAHRYLGPASVVNALFAGISLRVCRKKSGGVWAGFAAHFAYNMVSLALVAL